MNENTNMADWLPAAKPVAATLLLILLWSLESVLPAFSGRKRRASHAANNLSLGVFNAVVAALLFGSAMLDALNRVYGVDDVE